MEMKLAEALILRADCQKRFEQLKARADSSAMVQEGDQPAENPAELIAELEAVARELGLLIKRINRTNSVTLFEGERTVSDVLAERDVLLMRRKLYAGLAEAATVQQNRYMRTEVKYVSTLNVAENQKRADALAREYRELDARIQALNWDTELI